MGEDLALKMPQPESSGFIKTLNNMGFMTSVLDPFSQQFVEFSINAPGVALDIGAAYGVASIEVLRQGTKVIANDLDLRHLEILKSRIPKDWQANLFLLHGNLLEGSVTVPSDINIGSILLCRVLHFYTGEKIIEGIKNIYRILSKKGKIFVVAETPYLRNFQSFIPIYEKRKKTGLLWPGFIDNVMKFAPERGAYLPRQLHFLDSEILTKIFEGVGFTIEKIKMFSRTDFPPDLQWDGRESVGLIARKS